MKTFALTLAMLTLTSAAFATDRNYVAPKPQAAERAAAQPSRSNVQQDVNYADHHVHFVHNGK